jgi:hypothetical protein
LKKKIKENFSTLCTIAITFLLLNLIFQLPLELMYRALISISLIFIVNPLFRLIERVTGEMGQKEINKFAFWVVFVLIVWGSLTFQN